MATLSITYTPTVEGCNIIYFSVSPDRLQPSPMCSYVDNSPSVVGVPKNVAIDITSEEFTGEDKCLENYSGLITECESFDINYAVVPCCIGKFEDYTNIVRHIGDC